MGTVRLCDCATLDALPNLSRQIPPLGFRAKSALI